MKNHYKIGLCILFILFFKPAKSQIDSFRCMSTWYLQQQSDYQQLIDGFSKTVTQYRAQRADSFYTNLPNGQGILGGSTCPTTRYIIPVLFHVVYDPSNR